MISIYILSVYLEEETYFKFVADIIDVVAGVLKMG
jgi:hypothetical protein